MRWPERIPALPLLALLLLAATAVAQTESADFDEAGFEEAASTILCDCGCHPQSAKECACGRAAEMRREIAGYIAEGMTGEEVVELYVAKHGEKIRIAPTATGFNLVAWLGPAIGLLAAGGGLAVVLTRWSRRRGDADASDQPAPPPLDGAHRDRLRRALENLE